MSNNKKTSGAWGMAKSNEWRGLPSCPLCVCMSCRRVQNHPGLSADFLHTSAQYLPHFRRLGQEFTCPKGTPLKKKQEKLLGAVTRVATTAAPGKTEVLASEERSSGTASKTRKRKNNKPRRTEDVSPTPFRWAAQDSMLPGKKITENEKKKTLRSSPEP